MKYFTYASRYLSATDKRPGHVENVVSQGVSIDQNSDPTGTAEENI